jgi:hypothetical protein
MATPKFISLNIYYFFVMKTLKNPFFHFFLKYGVHNRYLQLLCSTTTL